MTQNDKTHKEGLLLGICCYLIWGLIPLYFKLLKGVPAWDIVAHRVLWSAVLLVFICVVRKRIGTLWQIIRTAAVMRMLTLSATLIGVNWLIYIWAVGANHLVATSLGYFLNPLVNVALGVVVLGERLRKAQLVAVIIAAIGVAIAAAGALSEIWISVSLGVSFGLYGLVRKQAPVTAIEGLAVETLILAPLCVLWLIWQGLHAQQAFGNEFGRSALLIGSAAVTSVPLVVFAMAAKKLPYATLGLIQYIAPSLVFAIATLGFHEHLAPQMLIAFVFIWVALAIFSADLLRGLMRRQMVV